METLVAVPPDAPPLAAIGHATNVLRGALDELHASTVSDSELLAVLGSVEEMGRLVDAARVAVAADAAHRSRPDLGHDGLAWRAGSRNALDLVTRTTRVSAREASQRIKLGATLASHVDVLGVQPSRFPVVAAALSSGALGTDAAKLIVDGLDSITHICPVDELDAAERSLVATATGAITDETIGLPGEGIAFAADLMRGQVEVWKARLDPDGSAPSAPTVEPRSSFGFARLKDGVYPFRGGATPEWRGVLDALVDTYLSAHSATSFPSAAEQARIEAGEVVPGADILGDDRTIDQKRADILRGIFDGTARDPGTPRMGGAAPQAIVHVNAVDLIENNGVGWLDGVEVPVSLETVKQLICAGGFETILIGKDGEILQHGLKQRFFTPAQRKAIGARDATCIIPGCTVAARWCEIHHVIPWWRGGPTNVENGVLLCWYHHHSIGTSGWQIRMVKGHPEVMAPPWMGGTGTWNRSRPHRATHPTRPRTRTRTRPRPRRA
jgi:hypothetical protein